MSPDLDELNTNGTTQITLKFFGILAAIAARAGMVNVCLSSGVTISGESLDNPRALGIGITNSIGSVLGSGLISVLSVDRLINEMTTQVSFEEECLSKDNLPKWLRCVITITALCGGIVSQVPMAIGAYFGAIPPIPASVYAGSQMADFSRPAYSIYHRLNECAIRSCFSCRSPYSKALMSLRDKLEEAIKQKKPVSESDLARFVEMIERNQTGEGLLEEVVINTSETNISKQDIAVDFVSTLIVLFLIAEYFMIAFEGTKILYKNDLAIPLTAGILSSLANADLLFRLTRTGVSHVRQMLFCNPASSTLKDLHPNLYPILTIMSWAISFLPWAPSIYFAKEYFPSSFQIPVGVISAVAIFLCSLSATYAFRDHVITKITEWKSDNPVLQMQKRLDRVIKGIHSASLGQIAYLYRSFSEEVKLKIVPDVVDRELLAESV